MWSTFAKTIVQKRKESSASGEIEKDAREFFDTFREQIDTLKHLEKNAANLLKKYSSKLSTFQVLSKDLESTMASADLTTGDKLQKVKELSQSNLSPQFAHQQPPNHQPHQQQFSTLQPQFIYIADNNQPQQQQAFYTGIQTPHQHQTTTFMHQQDMPAAFVDNPVNFEMEFNPPIQDNNMF